MKRIPIIAIILTTALIVAVILISRDARSETLPVLERNTVELNAFLTATLPVYPDVEPVVAQAYRASFIYWTSGEKGKVLVRGEDLPRMIYATKDFHGELSTLTIVIEGVPGTSSTLDTTNYPTVTFSPVELRVKAYAKNYVDVSGSDKPLVDFILSDVTMSTKEVCVEGWCDKGYLDAEALEAQLVFRAVLPEADYAPYNQWLAGETILGALRIQLPNPFAEK